MTQQDLAATQTHQKAPRRSRRKTVIRVVTVALMGMAVAKELRKPPEEREWTGKLWVIPYDLRPPTPSRLKATMWNPDEPRIFTTRPFGVGWTVNAGRLYHLWQQRQAA